ncbi:MAG TPA: hypothetical protein VG265_06670 [Gaiellaceae bacterium]|nr:hypothetical protein [Gaiellaceae bacterium]
MTTVPVTGTHPRATRRSLLDRLLAAFPVLMLVLAVVALYCVEAWSRKTPWIFSDELEWTQISRSIAATGHAARRTQPIYFKSLYAYFTAPFWWWFSSTPTAYAAIKYANAILMPLAAIPTYLLARMLVTRRSAVIVATLSILVPAMAYATSIVPEVMAYPYFALCSWLAVRALKTGARRDVVLAIAVTLGGYLIRQEEFSAVPAALAIAGAGLWLTGRRGRHLRRNWTRSDTIGAVVLAFGAFYLFNRIFLEHVNEWHSVTLYYKNRMIDLGLRAGLSLTIGLGVLPVVCGLTSLRLPERRGDPTYRAFAAWSAASIFAFSIYTADKAAYLENTFGTFWEERNMIYLSPLLLIGTALVFESKRLDWRLFSASSAFVLILIAFKSIQTGFGYYEAPGSTIAAMLSNYEGWSARQERWALIGLLAVSIAVIAARRRRAVVAVTSAFLLAWLLSGEIGMTVGINDGADHAASYLYSPPNWVDIASGGQPVAVIGQGFSPDANPLWETEFWNRTIDHVNDLDGTAPGPGPHGTTGLVDPTGVLEGYQSYPYVLAYNGVTLSGDLVKTEGCGATSCAWALYKKRGPWRLAEDETGVYSDGWCGTQCEYTYFLPHRKGTLEIVVGRTAYKGNAPPGKVTLEVGKVVLDSNHNPQLGRIEKIVHTTIDNGVQKHIEIPVAQTPVRVEIDIPNPIPPEGSESRSLGAQVEFFFHSTG